MAEIRCPNCGKNNPELLDACQFCLTPLKPDSVLRIGEQPTKKHTGELEPILPDWLKDVRQQARDSADEDAARAASQPKATDEPVDLLAGLASQTDSDDEEVPDWLASIAPPAESGAKATPSTPAETDFFAQFDRSRSEPEAAEENPTASEQRDELSDWFSRTAEQPEETVELEDEALPMDRSWASSYDAPAPPEEEDLSWLRNLEETAKQTGDLKPHARETDWTANLDAPSTPFPSNSSQGDLSWLDSLGGLPGSSQAPLAETPSTQDDLGWLNRLGGTPVSPSSESAEPEPAPFDAAPDRPLAEEAPFVPGENLEWLKDLGASSEAPASETSPQPFSDEGLSWLNQLDEPSAKSQPFDAANLPAPTEQPAWLRDLGEEAGAAAPPFVESEQPGAGEEQKEPEPDWLKSAAESPSMPAAGDLSMDWLKGEPPDRKAVPSEQTPFTDIFSSPAEEAPLSNRDLDPLFSAEMPDWLTRPEQGTNEPAQTMPAPPPPAGEESLAPVELPSWVQAMRPVEALISETAPGTENQPEEQQGPLAGLRGVIPGMLVGPSARPKAVSLKLQVTPEQQASAGLLEQILGTETNPRALVDAPFVAAQHLLRWALAGLFLLVLGAVISLRSQNMPVAAGLPPEGSNLGNAVLSIPANSNVLVVVDYEPSLAGEMEAIGSPLLNQMVSLGRHNLSLLSTSPNGPALVERLLTSAQINTSDGFGYQAGLQYRNLGFLPGGSAGVLGFMEAPASVVSGADVAAFSDYAAVVVLTDHAESGRVWVEQLQSRRQLDPALANQPLLMVASAQAGPLLLPYASSGQVDGMISGLSDAARYDANNGRSGAARLYWDPFGVGLSMAVIAIVAGSLWSLFTGIRARRTQGEQG
ncbi:MAG TPA: hypothetical protein VK900_10315 [Anaerolineales bacterium]|nr:hypothetical protein [Anaerolineales bacterium]